MSEQSQTIKIKCPHCGWIRKVEVQVVVDPATKEVTASINPTATRVAAGETRDTLHEIARQIEAALAGPELAEADAWLELAACPHCGKTYRYNVSTGEVEGEKPV